MWTNENLKTVVDALEEMIPLEGTVVNPVKNKKLDQLRKAFNVVHDIFNNGLCNKGKSLKCLGLKKWDLPLPSYSYGHYTDGNWDRIKEIVEPIMEKKILDAAVEQGIKMKLVPNTTTGKLELEVI